MAIEVYFIYVTKRYGCMARNVFNNHLHECRQDLVTDNTLIDILRWTGEHHKVQFLKFMFIFIMHYFVVHKYLFDGRCAVEVNMWSAQSTEL